MSDTFFLAALTFFSLLIALALQQSSIRRLERERAVLALRLRDIERAEADRMWANVQRRIAEEEDWPEVIGE